jgi:hypothetical protein
MYTIHSGSNRRRMLNKKLVACYSQGIFRQVFFIEKITSAEFWSYLCSGEKWKSRIRAFFVSNISCRYQFFLSKGCYLFQIGSGAPSSNDPKFERHLPGAPWPTFHKSNDAKLFLICILKALESLKTFRSGLVGVSFITRQTGAYGRF